MLNKVLWGKKIKQDGNMNECALGMKNTRNSSLHYIKKLTSKWIADVNVKYKTIYIENIEKNLCGFLRFHTYNTQSTSDSRTNW